MDCFHREFVSPSFPPFATFSFLYQLPVSPYSPKPTSYHELNLNTTEHNLPHILSVLDKVPYWQEELFLDGSRVAKQLATGWILKIVKMTKG